MIERKRIKNLKYVFSVHRVYTEKQVYGSIFHLLDFRIIKLASCTQNIRLGLMASHKLGFELRFKVKINNSLVDSVSHWSNEFYVFS